MRDFHRRRTLTSETRSHRYTREYARAVQLRKMILLGTQRGPTYNHVIIFGLIMI